MCVFCDFKKLNTVLLLDSVLIPFTFKEATCILAKSNEIVYAEIYKSILSKNNKHPSESIQIVNMITCKNPTQQNSYPK